MITSIEINSWTNSRTNKSFRKYTVHHKSSVSRILHYDPWDKLPKTITEYSEKATVTHSREFPDKGYETNRKYERYQII